MIKNILSQLIKSSGFLKEKRTEKEIPVYNKSKFVDDVRNAKNEWLAACNNYNFVMENEMLEYYIYNIKASQIKYEYYLKLAKSMENKDLSQNVYSNIKLDTAAESHFQ